MKIQTMAAAGTGRTDDNLAMRCCVLAALVALAVAPAAPRAAPAAGQNPNVKLETIPGSPIPRVILSAKAAERLGIEIARVGEEAVVRKQMVGGLIIPPMEHQPESKPAGGEFGGFARPASAAAAPQAAPPQAVPAKTGTATSKTSTVGLSSYAVAAGPAAQPAPQASQPAAAAAPGAAPAAAPATVRPGGPVWVLVTLSPGEWERLAKDKPARLTQLATREKFGTEIVAQPSGMAPAEDIKRSMLSVYYTLPALDHGLAVNNRVRVELQMAGSEDKQKVVPYSAVYYDAKGVPWVYVTPKPLTFERRRISVDRVVGNTAILADGPPLGTPVVSVGAALLYGAEIFKK